MQSGTVLQLNIPIPPIYCIYIYIKMTDEVTTMRERERKGILEEWLVVGS